MAREKLLYTVPEAAAALGISTRAVEHLLRTQRLPRRKIGRRVLVPADALRRFAGADQAGLGIPFRAESARAEGLAK